MTTLRTCLLLAPLSLFLMHCGDDASDADGSGGSSSSSPSSSAGGDGSGASGSGAQGGSGASPSDDTAPTVVSISPNDGAVGVSADTNIVIEFSEPMDKVATQAAYQSADVPAGGVTFSWNPAGTVLTIDPVADLEYATGASPEAVIAKSFAIAISDVATDEAGNALAEPATSTFSTLRRIAQPLGPDTSLCGLVRSDTGQTGSSTWIGDTSGNGQYKGFATMDIAPLPADIVSFEAATLRVEQLNSTSGDPYAGLGGMVNVHHVVFAQKDLAALSAPALSIAGVLSSDDTLEYKEISVLAQLQDDYEQREARLDRSQYRFEFPVVTDFDDAYDIAIFHSQTSELVVTYLVE